MASSAPTRTNTNPADRDASRRPLGERLIESGTITRAQLQIALAEHQRTNEPIGKILVSLGLVSQDQLSAVIFDDARIEYAQLRGRRVDPELLRGKNLDQLRELCAIPIAHADNHWVLAVSDPSDIMVADALATIFPGTRRIVGATASEILDSLREVATNLSAGMRPANITADAVTALDQILQEAAGRRATDVHIEPEEKIARVRFRVDGVLVAGPTFGLESANSIVSRLKIISGLDISIKRAPQDGRCRFQSSRGPIDCRVSTLPTIFGENAVIRLLDGSQGVPKLASLEFPAEIEKILKFKAALPHGIIYVVGATGSGKTTTLYALLSSIDAMQRKVCTVEDPVEYRLPLARQTQVQPEIGFDFAAALRALLRQDPDVILVGETRDQETAEIALRAALTGHMVMSTLHANRASGAAARLIQMGVDPFLLASTLTAVLAQTLLRRACSHCKESVAVTSAERDFYNSLDVPAPEAGVVCAGCENCNYTGYFGRCAVGELLIPSRTILDAMQRKASSLEVHALAVAEGLIPLERAAAQKAAAGVTTIVEVARVIGRPLESVK